MDTKTELESSRSRARSSGRLQSSFSSLSDFPSASNEGVVGKARGSRFFMLRTDLLGVMAEYDHFGLVLVKNEALERGGESEMATSKDVDE
jgi:hypothetical protein